MQNFATGPAAGGRSEPVQAAYRMKAGYFKARVLGKSKVAECPSPRVFRDAFWSDWCIAGSAGTERASSEFASKNPCKRRSRGPTWARSLEQGPSRRRSVRFFRGAQAALINRRRSL